MIWLLLFSLIWADFSRWNGLIGGIEGTLCHIGLRSGLYLLTKVGAACVGVDARPVLSINVVPGLGWRERPFGELRRASYNGNTRLWRFIVEIRGRAVEASTYKVIFTHSEQDGIVLDLIPDGTQGHIVDFGNERSALNKDVAFKACLYFAQPISM